MKANVIINQKGNHTWAVLVDGADLADSVSAVTIAVDGVGPATVTMELVDIPATFSGEAVVQWANGETLLRQLVRSDSHHVERSKTCPPCKADMTKVGLPQIAYTFETCECGTPDYPHLVEQLWHRACLPAPTGTFTREQLLTALVNLDWLVRDRPDIVSVSPESETVIDSDSGGVHVDVLTEAGYTPATLREDYDPGWEDPAHERGSHWEEG